MIQDLLNKYRIDQKYSTYLEKFIEDPYLMDINAYVLSKLDRNIDIRILYETTTGSYAITTEFKPMHQLDDIVNNEYYSEILISELVSLIEKKTLDNKILGIDKLVSKIGIVDNTTNLEFPNQELIPFTNFNFNINLGFRILLKSEITNDITLIRGEIRDEKINSIIDGTKY